MRVIAGAKMAGANDGGKFAPAKFVVAAGRPSERLEVSFPIARPRT